MCSNPSLDETMECNYALTLFVDDNKFIEWALRKVIARRLQITPAEFKVSFGLLGRKKELCYLWWSIDKASWKFHHGSLYESYIMIERMTEAIIYLGNDFCRICLDEICQHLLNNYPTLQWRKLQCLERCNFHNFECLKDDPLINLLRCIKSTGWFCLQQDEAVFE